MDGDKGRTFSTESIRRRGSREAPHTDGKRDAEGKRTRRRPFAHSGALSLLFFAAAVIYTIWPVDVIPDVLGPIGWVDDLALWAGVLVMEGLRRIGQRKRRAREALDNRHREDRFI